MSGAGGFDRDSNTPSRRLARALAVADQELRLALIDARRAAGLTQQDVADALGISQSAVSQFERADNDPQMSTVRRYALAVGAEVAHVVTDREGRVHRSGVGVPEGPTRTSRVG